MNGKAKIFAAYLESKKIHSFTVEELDDPHHSVIFRTSVALHGQAVPLGVIIDDTIYTLVRANLATGALDDKNAFALSSLMMRLNHESKLFKYYLAPDGSILLDACVPQQEGRFFPKLVLTIVDVVAKAVGREYASFLRILFEA